jgi:hypothetical protein
MPTQIHLIKQALDETAEWEEQQRSPLPGES